MLKISFREPTTAESISAAAYDFEKTKKEIFDPRWLQLGRIVRTSEGVFANPPEDAERNPVISEQVLKSHLNGAEKINGIWLYNGQDSRDFGFAPYESFTRGAQDCETFSQGGLARLFEHTKEKIAGNLKEISSPKFYRRGVDVWGFDEVKEPTLRVAGLNSNRGLGGDRLCVYGGNWIDGRGGVAFGVLQETSEAGSPKN